MAKKTTIIVNGWFLQEPYCGSGQYTLQLIKQLQKNNVFRYDIITPVEIPNMKTTVLSSWYPRKDLILKAMFEYAIGSYAKKKKQLLWTPYHSITQTPKHIMTIHDAIGYKEKWKQSQNWRQQQYKDFATTAAQKAQKIITISNGAKEDIANLLSVPKSKIAMIYNGINHNLYRPISEQAKEATKKKYQLPEHFLVYTGGFEQRKNTKLLTKLANRQDQPIVIIGTPPQPLPEHKNLIIKKGITDKEKAEIIAAANIFLWPSQEEGFGLPPLEAMACQTPVIARKASVMPEILKNAPLWCHTNETSEWILAIKQVQQQGMAEQLEQKGIALAKQYQWTDAAKQLEQQFHDNK